MTFIVYRCTKFREIAGFYPQDIVPYLLPSCVNVHCQWKINRTLFFSFVKAAQRLLSLRFGIRSHCFFQKKISKMAFFRSNGLEKKLPKVVVEALNRKKSLLKDQ